MPTGIRLLARINVLMGGHTTGSPKLYVSDLSQVDSAPGVGVTSLIQPTANTYTAGFFEITTNTSAQVRTRFSVSDAGTALEIDTLGWVDRRARV